MKYKMKIKKYVEDVSLSFEERYKQLEKHHLEETEELRKIVENLESMFNTCYECKMSDYHEYSCSSSGGSEREPVINVWELND